MMKLSEYFARPLTLGESRHFRGISVWPIFNGSGVQPNYLTLDEAMKTGVCRVTEVSPSGNVPELRFVNKADKPVFLMDGEELVGAKQNRVVNISILVPARSTIKIPVSCVEAGRWHPSSRTFASSPQAHFATARARRSKDISFSMQHAGKAVSDQVAVWDEVDQLMEGTGVSSLTRSMTDVFVQCAPTIEEYVEAFVSDKSQSGALFAVGARVIGLDVFDSPATLAKLLPKLVRAHAVDALARRARSRAPASRAQSFLQDVLESESSMFPAVGEGEDLRLTSPKVSGGALFAYERVVHLAAFRKRRSGNRTSYSDSWNGLYGDLII